MEIAWPDTKKKGRERLVAQVALECLVPPPHRERAPPFMLADPLQCRRPGPPPLILFLPESNFWHL